MAPTEPPAAPSGAPDAPAEGLRWPCIVNLPALKEEGWGLRGRLRASLRVAGAVWRSHRSLRRSYLGWFGLGCILMGLASHVLGAGTRPERALLALGIQAAWATLWLIHLGIHLGAVKDADGVRKAAFGLPNGLTLLRILLIPAVCWTILAHRRFLDHGALASALIFAVGFSDVLDGLLARALRFQTILGRYMDHVGDVLICSAIALAEYRAGLMPGWLMGLYLLRYLGAWVAGTYGVATRPDLRITPSLMGRVGTLVAGSTLFLTIAVPLSLSALGPAMPWIHGVTGAVIVANMAVLVVMALRGTAFEHAQDRGEDLTAEPGKAPPDQKRT